MRSTSTTYIRSSTPYLLLIPPLLEAERVQQIVKALDLFWCRSQSGPINLVYYSPCADYVPNLKAHNFGGYSGFCCTTSNLKEPVQITGTPEKDFIEKVSSVLYEVQLLIFSSLLHLNIGSIIYRAIMGRIRFLPTDQLHFNFFWQGTKCCESNHCALSVTLERFLMALIGSETTQHSSSKHLIFQKLVSTGKNFRVHVKNMWTTAFINRKIYIYSQYCYLRFAALPISWDQLKVRHC